MPNELLLLGITLLLRAQASQQNKKKISCGEAGDLESLKNCWGETVCPDKKPHTSNLRYVFSFFPLHLTRKLPGLRLSDIFSETPVDWSSFRSAACRATFRHRCHTHHHLRLP
ncbi:uncharacterized protein F4812DRAFT_106137 [Daldinia caldariorum]|uniref:uncharacterized protein n=1 Tax=Daldinia caldariorum TaxID=326644 RepID=UPI002008A744|nr:uncharacterized protein F4812DRAFT_106137 [Daldinia caldariorum]KAI1465681.1 hypothetical protein F4812DRAFT_106137 [Daldinia caldariorum]